MNTTNNKVWLKYFIGKHATAWIKGKDNLSKLSDHFEYITLLSLLPLYCYIMYLYTVRGNLVLMGVSLESDHHAFRICLCHTTFVTLEKLFDLVENQFLRL